VASEIEADILVGLVELRPRPGNDELDGAPGAYTNAVTRAADELEFRAKVAEVFGDLAYDVVHVSEIEPAAHRAARDALSETLLEAARRAPHADGVFWDTYYVFEKDDE
jgi:hypothetical protein